MNLEEIQRINENIKTHVLSNSEGSNIIYRALQEQMNKKINETPSYELSDVQVVRFYNDQDKDSIFYRFNVITKSILKIIENCGKCFEVIRNGLFLDGNSTIYLYDEVMNSLMNNENQFLLIQKLMHYKLSMPDKAKYNMNMIANILEINAEYLKEVGIMEKEAKDMIKTAKSHGFYLQKAYNDYAKKDDSNSVSGAGSNGDTYNKKLGSIAYRMLNALKTNNKHAFMDIMVNAHMYVQKAIPAIFAENLENDLNFKNLGYAFVTGMIGYADNNKGDGKENEKGNEEK